MSTESSWIYDSARASWYRFCPESNAFVYQDGQKIYPAPVPLYNPANERSAENESPELDEPLHSGPKFYRVGRVFYDVLMDPADAMKEAVQFYVVVQQRRDTSAAVPITTYDGQGVSNAELVKYRHAIIHTGDEKPTPLASEWPKRGERGMMKRIVVRPRNRNATLDPLARVNYGETYAWSHNHEVHYFGDVDPEYVSRLRRDWKDVRDNSEDLEENVENLEENVEDRGFDDSSYARRPPRAAAAMVAGLASILIGGYTLYTASQSTRGARRRRGQ